jgi:polysaccharide pyruvyl transferase WcaK-like protein
VKKKEETCYFFNLKIRCGILQFSVGFRDKKKRKKWSKMITKLKKLNEIKELKKMQNKIIQAFQFLLEVIGIVLCSSF